MDMTIDDLIEEMFSWQRNIPPIPDEFDLESQVKEFIENYNHIYYCEVIIHPSGYIEEARPSHLETLIRATKLERQAVYDLMPITAMPLDWLVEYTGCVAVWYNFQKLPPSMTDEQQYSLKALFEGKKIV